jgi:hypothetical protein
VDDSRRIALVLGGADCLWDDLDIARKLVDPEACTIVAVNDAGIYWPGRLDHWATMHPEELAGRAREREKLGHPGGYVTWTRPYPFGMKDREKLCDQIIDGYNGSSGLVAVGVAIETGHRRVLLCGMPMDARAHFNREGAWTAGIGYRERWLELADQLRLRCRSFSGWTRELLGEPTAEWVDSVAPTSVASR